MPARKSSYHGAGPGLALCRRAPGDRSPAAACASPPPARLVNRRLQQSDAVGPFALARQHGVVDRCAILQGRVDMPALYAAMDVFVLASHREGLSRSLVEAMAMARPVVTCDIRGCREVVVDGDSGRLVPERDAAALSLAVQGQLEDRAAE